MAADAFNLQRFLSAQQTMFDQALAEVQSGEKRSHWIWFIFPQLAGLGHSAVAQHYAIASLDEARAYLAHPMLGTRLERSIEALLAWAGRRSANEIFGSIDSMKLRSSLTLFSAAAEGESLFQRALATFFDGPDPLTLHLLGCA